MSGRIRSGIRSRDQDTSPNSHHPGGRPECSSYALKQKLIILCQNIDILSLSMVHSELYTCSSDGQIQVGAQTRSGHPNNTNLRGLKRWSSAFNCTASWGAHEGIVLSSVVTCSSEANGLVLVSGANDGFVKVSCPSHSSRSYITLHPDLGH